MNRIAWLCYAFCAIVAAGFIVATTASMPAEVASHFDVRNAANTFMPRSAYLALMLAIALGLPALIVGTIVLLARIRPDAINIPNRAYWLDPQHREEMIGALRARGAWFGCLLTVFIAGVHYLVLEANRATPPTLPLEMFFTWMVMFAAALDLLALSPLAVGDGPFEAAGATDGRQEGFPPSHRPERMGRARAARPGRASERQRADRIPAARCPWASRPPATATPARAGDGQPRRLVTSPTEADGRQGSVRLT